jgi:hypothetical protein
MAQYNDLPVYKASYDMLLAIFAFTKNFSREYKYTIGERLKNEVIELFILIYRANSTYNKADILKLAREQVEIIRVLIRVMKDMKQISLSSFVAINQNVENVSKQLAGWHKSVKS